MKRFLKITALAFTVMFFSATRNKASAQVSVSANISYQDFYNDLSPYGNWIDYPEYGYVWQFSGDPDFRPYSSMGHWEWSDDYDWIWVSDYSWGWAPFHYGRWFFDAAYGWLWVPGYDWSPAWVAWRSGGDYYGWAPLNPGIGIGFSLVDYAPPVDYWCFVSRGYITSPRIYDYCVSSRQNFSIFNRTTIINNYNFYGGRGRNVFVNGPGRGEVEGYTHRRINPIVFRESNRPGATQLRNNEISMYRPNVQRDNNRRFTPNNVVRYNNNNNGFRRNDNFNNRDNNNTVVRRDDNRDRNNWQDRNDRNVIDRNNNLPNRNNQQPDQRVEPFRRNDQRPEQRIDPFRRNDQQPNQNTNRNVDRNNWGNQNNNNNRPEINRNQVQQQQQQQPRQFERRDNNNNNRQPGNNDNNRGGGNGRGRRGG